MTKQHHLTKTGYTPKFCKMIFVDCISLLSVMSLLKNAQTKPKKIKPKRQPKANQKPTKKKKKKKRTLANKPARFDKIRPSRHMSS